MSKQATARDEILTRISSALHVEAGPPITSYTTISRHYQRTGSLTLEACLDLFLDRLLDYDAEVIQIETARNLPTAIAESLHRAGENQVGISAEFPPEWLPTGLNIHIDKALSTAQLDAIEAVITTCEVAVATTGTIFLVHHEAQGRRALTLLPDHHICLVRRNQIVESIPEGLAALNAYGSCPLTTISGPSATSDIEMTRIRGVHGPRRLTVILYG